MKTTEWLIIAAAGVGVFLLLKRFGTGSGLRLSSDPRIPPVQRVVTAQEFMAAPSGFSSWPYPVGVMV